MLPWLTSGLFLWKDGGIAKKRKGYITVRVWQRKLKGRNAYYLRWTDKNGSRHAEACQARTRADANIFAKKKERDLNDGAYIDLKPITFDEFRQEHIGLLESTVSMKTLADHERVLRQFAEACSPAWLTDVAPGMVEKFLSGRRRRRKQDGKPELSDDTVNKDLRVLKSAFNYSIRRGYLRTNPCRDIKPKRIPKKDIRILNDDEVASPLNACPNGRWQGFLLVQIQSGLRLGEVQYLEWSDIDWQHHVVKMRNKAEHALKDKEPREAPLYPETERLLLTLHQKAREGSRYAFETERGRPWVNNLHRNLRRIVRNAGIAKCTFHDLRRTAITHWVREGWDIATVKEAAGHSSITTTERYYMKASQKAIRNAWKNALSVESEGENGTYSEHGVNSANTASPAADANSFTSRS